MGRIFNFGAALRDVCSFHRERLSAAHKGENVKKENVIAAPEVREIIVRLLQAREQHSAIAVEKMEADSEAARLEAEIGRVQNQLDAQEKAMAISGAVPEEAFPEEIQIAALERKRRVALARVSVIQERVTASQDVINDIRKQLDTAWLQFGIGAVREVVDRFVQVALELRKVHCEHIAWLQQFHNKPGVIEGFDVVVADPVTKRTTLVDHRAAYNEEYWKPYAGDLAEGLRALHNEVEAAKGE